MKKMTHLERLLSALYVSEAWHVLWREHKDIAFLTRAMISFDRAIQNKTWNDLSKIKF
jgi:hypothetical protein